MKRRRTSNRNFKRTARRQNGRNRARVSRGGIRF